MSGQAEISKWRDYKFGMFIHYGLYSVLGEGEWAMYNKPIDRDEYAKLAEQFTAERFDAGHLAALAKRAGMKYMVLTSRHHDGFCLFDSHCSVGDFTVMHTPAGRDLLREYVEACRREGMAAGIYYSPMDWRFEGFFFPKMYQKSALRMRQQCHEQVRELMSNYGKIDILWYDGGEDHWLAHGRDLHAEVPRPENWRERPIVEEFWGEYELDAMVRGLQPHIVINNRLGRRRLGDYTTPERIVGSFDKEHPWETCDTISESWGWMPGTRLRSLEEVIHLLIDVVTGGGNLLLNVSPMGDGSLEESHERRLLEIGDWLGRYGEAIYGTKGGPILNDKEYGGAVSRGNAVYLLIKNKNCTVVRLPLLGAGMKQVSALTGEEGVTAAEENGILTIKLPERNRASVATIVKVELDRDVAAHYKDFDVRASGMKHYL